MNGYRIEQVGPQEWCVRYGDTRHFAQTAEDAVKLMLALNTLA